MSDEMKTVIEVIAGVEGLSLAIMQVDEEGRGHGERIAGPKPWGGGKTIHRFAVDPDRVRAALPKDGDGDTADVYEFLDKVNTFEECQEAVTELVRAANPDQSVLVERHHCDRDGKWMTVIVKPHITGVQEVVLKELERKAVQRRNADTLG
jgi:hypothetical protein